jgi:hypothetical protein
LDKKNKKLIARIFSVRWFVKFDDILFFWYLLIITWVKCFRVQGSGFRDQGSGLKVQGSGFRDQGSRFRAQGSGLRDQGSGIRVNGLKKSYNNNFIQPINENSPQRRTKWL